MHTRAFRHSGDGGAVEPVGGQLLERRGQHGLADMLAAAMRCPAAIAQDYRKFTCNTAVKRGACYCKSTCDRSDAWTRQHLGSNCAGTTPPIGYRHFHPDISINFQCNRWVQWIGPSAIDEVAELAAHADTYPELIDGFLALAERARGEGRAIAGAYYDRAAEFFLSATTHAAPLLANGFSRRCAPHTA